MITKLSAWFAYKYKTLKMSTLNKKEKKIWIKSAHIFVALFFILGIFSFYVSNVYSYPGEDNLGSQNCTDSMDNDSDGYIDLDDSQCIEPPSTPDLLSGSDTGSSDTDNITTNYHPDISVACQSNYIVKLYMGGVQIGPDVVCSANTAGFSLFAMPQSLAEGSNTFTATHNKNGETEHSGILTVTLDTTPPDAPGIPDMTAGTDTGSSSIDNLTSDTSPDFTISCENGATVELMNGVTNIGTGTCSGGTVTITANPAFADGNVGYSLTSRQTDVAGAGTTEALASLDIVIDTIAPTTSDEPDMTDATDSGSSNSDDITSDTTPTFTGVCTDGNTVQLYDGGVSSGSSAVCTSSVFSLTSDALAQGPHSITFEETDPAGNASVSSALSVTIDTTAPTTSGAPDMTSGTDLGSSSADNITSDTTPTFTGVCTDGNTVQLFDDGSSSGSSSTCASSVFSLTTGTLATGSNSITFKETDTAGNISSASSALVVTIDATSPTISEVTAVPAGTDTTPDYTFTTDEAGTISYGGSCSSITTSATSGSNTITLDALAVGTYADCTVIVTDSASNASNTLTLTSFTISAPAAEAVAVESSNLSGSASNTTRQTQTNNDTPRLPACLGGALYNIYTGLPCQTTTPITPGCFTGFNFSILTGESCKTTTETPSTPTPNTPPTPINLNKYIFTKDIPFGVTFSDDAKQLQIFLNNNGFPIASTGPGSPGKETRYFGPATRTALIKFQTSYNITPAIGYFGPKTRALINSL